MATGSSEFETTTSAEAVQPVPIRYWWLKRIFVFALVLITLLGVIRWRWGVYAENAFNREIERYRALGQPVEPEDFNTPPLPDDQNAALLINKAIKADKLTAKEHSRISGWLDKPETIAPSRDEIKQLLDKTVEPRALVRQARSLPGAWWGRESNWLHLAGTPPINYGSCYELNKTMQLVAVTTHMDGNDHEAVETMLDMLSCGRHVSNVPTMISALGDASARNRVTNVLESMRLTFEIAGNNAAAQQPSSRPALREQVHELIARLLDFRSSQTAATRSLFAERVFRIEGIHMILADPSTLSLAGTLPVPRSGIQRAVDWLYRPMYQLDGVRVLRNATATAEAMGAPDWKTAAKCMPKPSSVTMTSSPYVKATRIFSLFVTPNYDSTIRSYFETITRGQLAATALAIRLYELDHGKPPQSLSDLVPDYLPELPKDLFSPDGHTLRYKPDKNDPTVYSVGSNYTIKYHVYGTSPRVMSRPSASK